MAGEHLPLQRRDRPGLAPEFPHRSPVCGARSSIGCQWPDSRSRSTSTACSPTRDRSGTRGSRTRRGARGSSSTCPRTGRRRRRCSTRRSATGGRCWSASPPTGRRSGSGRAPTRTRALRRLAATGARIGVFTDAPRELVEIALAHAGAARQVEVVGTLAEVRGGARRGGRRRAVAGGARGAATRMSAWSTTSPTGAST